MVGEKPVESRYPQQYIVPDDLSDASRYADKAQRIVSTSLVNE